jgi:hypothetical protein
MTDVRMPDGAVVRFPDTMPPEQIKALIAKKFPQAAPPSAGQTMMDVGQQLGAAIPRGAAQVAGMPGDIFKLTVRGLDAGRNFLMGGDKQTDMSSDPVGRFVDQYMTSDAIKRNASNMTGVTLPTAQTTAGDIAGKMGEAAVGAAALSPWRSFLGAVENGIKFGAVPVGAGEAVGAGLEATGQPKGLADVARVGTAVATGGLMTLKPRMVAETSSALGKRALGLLKSAKAEGVTVAPNAMTRLATEMELALRKAGGGGSSAATLNPRTNAVMNEIMDVGTSGHPATLDDLEQLRRTISHAGRALEGSDPAMAAVMRQKMDEFIDGLKPGDVTSQGNPAKATALLKEYRQTYARAKKGELLAGLMEEAKNSQAWASGNKSAAIRSAFRSLANDDKEMRYFSAVEKRAILDAVRVSKFEGLMTIVGRLSPAASLRSASVGSGIGGGAGFLLGGPIGAGIGAAAVPVAGEMGREIANQIARRDANMASTVLRGGKVTPIPSMIPMTGVYGESIYNRGSRSR